MSLKENASIWNHELARGGLHGEIMRMNSGGKNEGPDSSEIGESANSDKGGGGNVEIASDNETQDTSVNKAHRNIANVRGN